MSNQTKDNIDLLLCGSCRAKCEDPVEGLFHSPTPEDEPCIMCLFDMAIAMRQEAEMRLAALEESVDKKLMEVISQLEKWADESMSGGWSTHQVKPMRDKATELKAFLYDMSGIVVRGKQEDV